MAKCCVLFTLVATSYTVQYTCDGVAYIEPDVYVINADRLSAFQVFCNSLGISLINTSAMDPIVIDYLTHLM